MTPEGVMGYFYMMIRIELSGLFACACPLYAISDTGLIDWLKSTFRRDT
jgi:hypothetical protein